MSLPATGFVRVETALGECSFDGNKWSANDASLAKRLNESLRSMPVHHYSIDTIAERCLEGAGISGKILDARQDQWSEEDSHIDGID